MPPQLLCGFIEHATARDLPLPCFIDEAVVKLEHRKMHLRDQRV